MTDDATTRATGIDSAAAWRVAVAAAVVVGVSFGSLYSFGAFFDAMAAEFSAGLGPTSTVFGLTAFLFFGTGAASGFLADRYGPRPLVWAGGALFALGLFGTSRATELWHGYLTFGIGAGFGGGLFVSSLFAAAAGWFETRRGIAQGVVATGSGLGTLLLLPLSERIIDAEGWRQGFVVLAVISGIVFALGGAFLAKPPVDAPTAARSHLSAVLRSVAFRRLTLSAGLHSASMISAFAFLVPFSTDAGVASSTAALLVGVIGASSIVGRLALTGFADAFGPVRTLQLSFLVQPVAFAIWFLAGDRLWALGIFVVVLGVAYGGFVALLGVVVAHLFGVRGVGSVMGWAYLSAGTGSLFGPPIVGFVADSADSNRVPILVTVALSALGAVLLLRLQREPVAELSVPVAASAAAPVADGSTVE